MSNAYTQKEILDFILKEVREISREKRVLTDRSWMVGSGEYIVHLNTYGVAISHEHLLDAIKNAMDWVKYRSDTSDYTYKIIEEEDE
jgi:hypothetical protein